MIETIMAMIFLLAMTVFNIVFYVKPVPIIQLIIGIMLVFATVPILELFSTMSFIPLAFLVMNLVLMVHGLSRSLK